uniref:Flocculation protein FLO11-like n=1 Tax=Mesocestoides corti TaxID=53468 RepID=A0A5K3FYG9_MESCO
MPLFISGNRFHDPSLKTQSDGSHFRLSEKRESVSQIPPPAKTQPSANTSTMSSAVKEPCSSPNASSEDFYEEAEFDVTPTLVDPIAADMVELSISAEPSTTASSQSKAVDLDPFKAEFDMTPTLADPIAADMVKLSISPETSTTTSSQSNTVDLDPYKDIESRLPDSPNEPFKLADALEDLNIEPPPDTDFPELRRDMV